MSVARFAVVRNVLQERVVEELNRRERDHGHRKFTVISLVFDGHVWTALLDYGEHAVYE
jgi:hypothetical protein